MSALFVKQAKPFTGVHNKERPPKKPFNQWL